MADLPQTVVEVQEVSGKGRGVVAKEDIASGTRIMCEKPLFTVANTQPEVLNKVVASKVKDLSKEQQRQFLSLHNSHPGQYPFSGIVKTNCLPCGPGARVGGIYPTICLINHDCVPNTNHSWNEDGGFETIHAVRPIKQGEEITIDYSASGPSYARQAQLRDSFGFDCHCNICSLSPDAIKLSDTRRLEIERLDAAIGDPGRMMERPSACLADCRSLAQLLEEEYNGSAFTLRARVCYDAFQICAAHGDRSRASAFAERAYKARVMGEGEDNPDTKKMKRYTQDPTLHSNFGGYSHRWKGSSRFSPSALSEAEFEAWLWRRAG
ncbi:hypothetical protein M426DRAFT_325258 [Hypoxylon sp. CI-4A]|nr:hypothetical protein M426DRAFT_325258 [Hypoxylon sp. CI-4A]